MVSIIILNFNGRRFLTQCLDSVLKSDYPSFDVILVDNASIDESIELVQRNFGQYSNLKIILNNRNLGFAEGNNVGARVAKGKYFVFLNNDTEVESKWLSELVTAMESDGAIGVAQSKLLLFNSERFDSAGDFISFSGRRWMRGHGDKDEGQYDRVSEIFSARGAAMAIRRQVLDDVGCFDSDFFMICEDMDLCWRIRLNGYKVVFVPKSVVYHFSSGTRAKTQGSRESCYYNVRNGIIMLIKNYDSENLFRNIIVNVLSELALFLMSLPFPSKRSYNLSRLRALIWVLLNFKHIWEKRLNVQCRVRKVSDSLIKKAMIRGNSPFLSVIWELLYKNRVDYNRFLNKQIFLKNR